MLTGDSITNAQLRDLLADLTRPNSPDGRDLEHPDYTAIRHAEVASSDWYRMMAPNEWRAARAHCAEILNARKAAMLTADTITNEQIRELQRSLQPAHMLNPDWLACENALDLCRGTSPQSRMRDRARCAEILNARSPK